MGGLGRLEYGLPSIFWMSTTGSNPEVVRKRERKMKKKNSKSMPIRKGEKKEMEQVWYETRHETKNAALSSVLAFFLVIKLIATTLKISMNVFGRLLRTALCKKNRHGLQG